MVSSLREPEGKRLMTGIIDGKANGNQAFSGDSFTMEFFFHSLDEAVKIVKAYEKTSENKRINQSRRNRAQHEDRDAGDALQSNDKELNSQCDGKFGGGFRSKTQ